MDNKPELWIGQFPFPTSEQHKYDRGHVVVSGGGNECTGAACLAATAALRVGAGLVTVATPVESLSIYAAKLNSVMAKPFVGVSGFRNFISDPRINVILLGPGNGANEITAEKVATALNMGKACILDADALTCFKNKKEMLFTQIKSPVVLTPHEGEFEKLFGSSAITSKTDRATYAAKLSGAIVVLKGNSTVIAAPDGRLITNHNAPPTLATAGSGDVLSGIITGLIAQKMEAFAASCCAVWLHSKAAEIFGLGLISEDLLTTLPMAIKMLRN